jgi:hypothetical protein
MPSRQKLVYLTKRMVKALMSLRRAIVLTEGRWQESTSPARPFSQGQGKYTYCETCSNRIVPPQKGLQSCVCCRMQTDMPIPIICNNGCVVDRLAMKTFCILPENHSHQAQRTTVIQVVIRNTFSKKGLRKKGAMKTRGMRSWWCEKPEA